MVKLYRYRVGLHTGRRALDHPTFDLDDASPFVALEDLRDTDVGPRTPPRPSPLPGVHGCATCVPHGPDVRHQAIRADQQPVGLEWHSVRLQVFAVSRLHTMYDVVSS